MTTLEFLGIYEDTIEKAANVAENAVAFYCNNDVDFLDEFHSAVKESIFDLEEKNVSDFTNHIIASYYTEAEAIINEMHPELDIMPDVDGWMSSFSVNKKEVPRDIKLMSIDVLDIDKALKGSCPDVYDSLSHDEIRECTDYVMDRMSDDDIHSYAELYEKINNSNVLDEQAADDLNELYNSCSAEQADVFCDILETAGLSEEFNSMQNGDWEEPYCPSSIIIKKIDMNALIDYYSNINDPSNKRIFNDVMECAGLESEFKKAVQMKQMTIKKCR